MGTTNFSVCMGAQLTDELGCSANSLSANAFCCIRERFNRVVPIDNLIGSRMLDPLAGEVEFFKAHVNDAIRAYEPERGSRSAAILKIGT